MFHRARPTLEHPLVELPSYSFPSGHALGGTVFYGFAAVLLWSYVAPKVWRVVIATVVIVLVLMVGFSRVYLGAHYPTDVLAGFLEGVAARLCWNDHEPPSTRYDRNDITI